MSTERAVAIASARARKKTTQAVIFIVERDVDVACVAAAHAVGEELQFQLRLLLRAGMI